MQFDDLQNIDFNDIASWPFWLKIVGMIFIAVAILFAGYWFVIKGQLETLENAEREEQKLRATYLSKAALAVNLPAYRKQVQEIQQNFGVMLRQLPNRTEVPELLIDITQVGLGRGLKFVLFKPQRKQVRDFYAVLPINLQVVGNYHQLGEFVSDLASMPRIVTLGNININPSTPGSRQLRMSAVVRTYHYLNEQEIQAQRARKNAAKKKSKRRRR
ncbi:type 4a pilus biogenesis protein PilO [Pseudomonadota bacterium]